MIALQRLQRYEDKNGATPIAVIGAGYVASGVIHVLARTPGVRPAIVINRNVDRAIRAFTSLGIAPDDIVVSDKVSVLADAVADGRPAVSSCSEVLTNVPVRLVIEATGALDYGTRTILAALDHGLDVISYNAEVDVLLARLFHERAKANGAIYTIADGDQPGAQFRLAQQIESMGFESVIMLNCKRHLDTSQTPSSGAGYAARDTTSAIMTTSFGDGTKMQVEQAVVANATGMTPDVRGMHGPRTTQAEVLMEMAALMSDGQHVDYTLGGDFGAGVGLIARHPDGPLHARAMAFYKMGDGPEYFFFRPYHLVHLELSLTLADVLCDREPLARVSAAHVATVVAMAKKDLASGEKLDCIGGFSAYGHIDTVERGGHLLPVGLVEFATMTAPVASDQPIPLASVELDASKRVVREWLTLQAR